VSDLATKAELIAEVCGAGLFIGVNGSTAVASGHPSRRIAFAMLLQRRAQLRSRGDEVGRGCKDESNSEAPYKNIENNPMQSSPVSAGMDALRDPAKTFDTSGKSPAYIHHRKI
jgi:hypothetical protein